MKIHTIRGYIQSIYLVEYSDKLLLLDGCSRIDHDCVIDYIEHTLKRSRHDLTLILVTHMHPDHAGGVHSLAKTCGANIATSNAPGQWYSGFDGLLMHWTDMLLAAYVGKRKGKRWQLRYYPRHLKADHYLADGMTLPDFDDWQIIHTPGHTDRDIAVLHLPSQRIYVADLMVKVKGKLLAPFPLFYPKHYCHSLLAIKLLAPSSLLLAHEGEIPFADIDFDALIDSAPKVPVTHWRSIKSKFKQALGGR